MAILLIGSQALREWGIEVDRPKLDFDFIAKPEDVPSLVLSNIEKGITGRIVTPEDAKHVFVIPTGEFEGKAPVLDIELAWPDSVSSDLIDLVLQHHLYKETAEGYLAVKPSVVLALKVSHKYKKNSPHFLKTMRDIQRLKGMGVKVPKVLSEWLKARKKWTYDYKHPKLEGGVSKSDFFKDDGIRYVYDHDSIHVAVKHLYQPAYRFFQPDGEEVGTSKEEFFAQPRIIQLLAVLEESYVLSLERAIVPFDLTGYDARKTAFMTALIKVCTSITSGWFRKFAWDNFDEVLKMYDQEYVDRFWNEVNLGNVAPYVKPGG